MSAAVGTPALQLPAVNQLLSAAPFVQSVDTAYAGTARRNPPTIAPANAAASQRTQRDDFLWMKTCAIEAAPEGTPTNNIHIEAPRLTPNPTSGATWELVWFWTAT